MIRRSVISTGATMLVATACGMVDVVLIMAGKATWNLANVLAAFVVMVGLDLWLIPQLGILGAAIGWSASILVGNLVPLIQVRHALACHGRFHPCLQSKASSRPRGTARVHPHPRLRFTRLKLDRSGNRDVLTRHPAAVESIAR